ncbi:sulfur carrier protein ThiS [Thalassobellus suaedae]|uniref:Sulfur carrier protein ThiS n=1 Tax=Thalassobellus suaedae TaxID=3074124 RepID=A0ABY9Y707_9FLAO|nr:sulfur carrier protein ThiS [Flavobacteriaceae bacterium HL-DH14]WNH14049.1 sulfur carrier protein ThiS [Flavobacteriaceae bacterium HL-DH10]
MITIHLNEQALNIDNNVNISQLLQQENFPQIGIAVAINQQIISKSNWEEQLLQDGDNILIIQATQGG